MSDVWIMYLELFGNKHCDSDILCVKWAWQSDSKSVKLLICPPTSDSNV